jgi:hypothetical protein
LPAVSSTFAISTYSLEHEILTAANVLKPSVPSTLKLACIGLACVLSVGPTPKHCGNGVVLFDKQRGNANNSDQLVIISHQLSHRRHTRVTIRSADGPGYRLTYRKELCVKCKDSCNLGCF